MDVVKSFFGYFTQKKSKKLEFEGLNPLLARQLSEVESQIGQLLQAQFDIAQEREKMRFEMASLKDALNVQRVEQAQELQNKNNVVNPKV